MHVLIQLSRVSPPDRVDFLVVLFRALKAGITYRCDRWEGVFATACVRRGRASALSGSLAKQDEYFVGELRCCWIPLLRIDMIHLHGIECLMALPNFACSYSPIDNSIVQRCTRGYRNNRISVAGPRREQRVTGNHRVEAVMHTRTTRLSNRGICV
jgi:hypothetical protein